MFQAFLCRAAGGVGPYGTDYYQYKEKRMNYTEYIVNLILLFFVFSIAGWCMEVTLKYFEFGRFINRGFLTGPWLPIYGFGAVLCTVGTHALAPVESGYLTTFAICFILCGVLEYMTSYILEKRFHARWWDYSKKPMNLHGRVWIGNLVLFGLGGVLIVHVFDPLLYKLFARVPLNARETLAAVLTALITADFIMSHFILKLVKTGVEKSKADNTEQISREVRLLLSDRSVFHRRFADAYPEVIYRTERVAQRMEAIRQETERLRREAEQRAAGVGQRLEAGRDQLAARLEPTAMLKSGVIEKQEELIGLLYDESAATEEMKELKREIDKDMTRLRDRRPLRK